MIYSCNIIPNAVLIYTVFFAQAGLLEPDSVEGTEGDIPEFNISYKPQKISPKFESTVRNLLHKKIQGSYMHPQFVSDVMKPLQIERLMDQQVQNLSGGELQRVALCICLGKVCSVFYIHWAPYLTYAFRKWRCNLNYSRL